ncbi:MAG: SIS domain-containing protein [archaeon]
MGKDRRGKLIQLYINEKRKILDTFPVKNVVDAANLVVSTYLNDGTVFSCGNGGSVSYAECLDLYLSNHPFVRNDKGRPLSEDVKRLRTYNLTSSSGDLTGIANDFGFGFVFGNQLEAQRIKEGDLVVGFTSSGNTKNVLYAFEIAKKHNAKTFVITKGSGGSAKDLADLCIAIPGDSNFPGQIGKNNNCFHYEDSIMSIIHMITGLLKKRIQQIYGHKEDSGKAYLFDCELVRLYLKEAKECLDNFPVSDVSNMAKMIEEAYFNGGSLYLCGNGSNATLLGNLSCDLGIHPFVGEDKSKSKFDDVKRFRVVNLADSGSRISGYANDYGIREIFSQQLRNLRIGRDDLVIGFTGSGNSSNILEAFRVAKKHQSKTVGIMRRESGCVEELSDLCIKVSTDSEFPGQMGKNQGNFHYEDSLLSISHIVTGILLSRIEEINSKD